MNAELVDKSVRFNGKRLFDLILDENNCAPVATTPPTTDVESEEHEAAAAKLHSTCLRRGDALNERLLRFIAKKSDFLFAEREHQPQPQAQPQQSDASRSNLQIDLPPIETYVRMSTHFQRKHLFAVREDQLKTKLEYR